MVAQVGSINSNMQSISKDEVKGRLKELNQDTPTFYTTSFIKEPQEITLRTVARNNIMLDKILANQELIIKNQNEILGKNAKNLDVTV